MMVVLQTVTDNISQQKRNWQEEATKRYFNREALKQSVEACELYRDKIRKLL